jgi:translation initiation factor 2B subunit (eIF-2B alpha/beta/delta family)/8-oxo-dGTP pyrophosphatase MutT (NUDIX family)
MTIVRKMPDWQRQHLAPISGSIDHPESPVAAAWREINEETSLTPRDIELWRQGKLYSFSDPSIGRQWTIYPFAFRLKGPDEGGRGETAIKIDWEHEAWHWYDPLKVVDDENFGGVPRLAESLRRVYFEMDMNDKASGALRSGLDQLKADHSSGSHELTTIALKAFRDVLVHLKDDPNWWETTRMAAWHLWKNGRESMGSATLNAFLEVLADIDDINKTKSEIQWDRILTVLDHHLERRRETASHIKETFNAYLHSTFLPRIQSQGKNKITLLTLSASSTIRDSILDAFKSLPVSHLDLRILESRPLFEGASMASSLLSEFEIKFPPPSGQHLQIRIYTDASAALAARDVDFVLLGADRISSSGSVSNKTGSLPAVLSTKHISPEALVLVFSGLEKVAEPGAEDDHEPEENNPMEVISPWVDSGIKGVKKLIGGTNNETSNCVVEVKNVYFEWVDANMVDAFITEEGALGATQIRSKAQEVKRKVDKYFSSL